METSILSERLGGLFTRYVSLAVLSQLGFALYVLADTFFIANGVGSEGLVALNLSLPIYSFINALGLLFGIGGATLFSTRSGDAHVRGVSFRAEGSVLFTRALLLGLMVGVVLTLCGLLLPRQLAWLLGARGTSLLFSAQYLGTIMTFSIAFICNNIAVAFVRNDGEPQLAMAAMMTGSFANIILDYLFVFPLDMGLFGAALATGIAPVLGLFVCSLHWLRRRARIGLAHPSFSLREIQRLLSGGIAACITELSSGTVIFVFNLVLLALAGDIAVATYSIIANVSLVCTSLFVGIGQGVQPILSHNYGAGLTTRVHHTLLLGTVSALLAGALFFALGLLFPEQITAAFNRDNDPTLTAYTVHGIRLYFSAFLFMGLNILLSSYFAALGHGREAFVISIVRGFAAMIPLVLLFSRLFGVTGVWLTIPAAECIGLLFGAILLTRQTATRKISLGIDEASKKRVY